MNKEKTLSSKQIYKGRVISLYLNDVICNNNVKSTREIVKHPGGACILCEYQGKIVFVKQYRAPFDDFILELPAGKIDNNEDPIETARRELEEETGLVSNSLKSLGQFYPTVGYSNEIIHLFYTNDASQGSQKFDFDENVELVYMTIYEVKEKLKENYFKDGKTIAALYKYLYS